MRNIYAASWDLFTLTVEADSRDLKQDDDDGSENAGKKMDLRSFKLNRVCLDPPNMSNAGDFSWWWILKEFYSG